MTTTPETTTVPGNIEELENEVARDPEMQALAAQTMANLKDLGHRPNDLVLTTWNLRGFGAADIIDPDRDR